MLVKKYGFTLFIVLFVFTAFAQNIALNKIDTVDLRRHLSFLASDSLHGRAFGTNTDGLTIAAEYLAGQAQYNGLLPFNNLYFQQVKLNAVKAGTKTILQPVKKGKNLHPEFAAVTLNPEIGNINKRDLQLVFAAFGDDSVLISSLSKESVKGKIIIVSQGNEEIVKDQKEFRWNNSIERRKIEKLSVLEPEAIVFITLPGDKKNNTFKQIGSWLKRDKYILESEKSTIPLVISTPDFADYLLGKRGKWEEILKKCISGKIDRYFTLKGKVNYSISVNSELLNAQNVMGIIPGSDSILQNECVVLMAHYDHLGIDKDGEIYNGADDNGSGSVLLLEVAEAFSSMKVKPKRSIVFLWVTGEEIGLLGSRFYTENPIFPLEKTKACINIDMAGRVYEPRDSVWKKSPKMVKDFDGLFTLSNDVWPELKKINQRNCEKLGLIPDSSLPAYFLRSSDHFHFHNNSVPILNYATGYHADYHKVSDEVDKINFQKLKRVADLCFLVAEEVANAE